MKRTIALFIVAAMCLCLFAACGAAEPEAPAKSQEQTVYNVDQLLDAIAPDAKIHLAPGTYHLDEASNYGKPTGSLYYRWKDTGSGFGLEINGVTGMELIAEDAGKTELTTGEYWADVVLFTDCSDIFLSGITAGHFGGAGGCSGDVLRLQRCSKISMEKMHLYGCGVIGVEAQESADIRIASSEIYECSSSGVAGYGVQGMTVENCVFHDVGRTSDYYGASAIVSLSNSENVTVADCEIRENTADGVLSAWSCSEVSFRNNRLADNDLWYVFNGDGLTVADNTFDGNRLSCWYGPESADAVDAEGNPIPEEGWREMYPDAIPEHHSVPGDADVISVNSGAQKVVHVSTADEFLAAIAPDTTIVIDAELIGLWEASDYGKGNTEHYYWQEEFDGPELVIYNVDNLTILGDEENMTAHTISASPRYADVLSFDGCTATTVAGVTVGHTVEPGFCSGGVLRFENCWASLVNNCGLYGCGTLGVSGMNNWDMQIKNCNIYECSYGGIELYNCSNVDIAGCDYWDLGGSIYAINGCTGVTVDGVAMAGNYYGD